MSNALLTVRGLSITTLPRAGAAGQTLLQALDFSLAAGECLTLVGESGAGKSLLAQAVMGSLPAGLLAQGEIDVSGSRSPAQAVALRRPRWGRQMALLPQEPWLALDPTMRVAPQLAEVHAWVRQPAVSWPAAHAATAQDLARLDLGHAARLLPGQLSGGMAQRVAFAVALAGGAKLLMVDEPTKGLDAALRGQLLAQLQATQAAGGAVLAITHDIGLARALGGQVLVLRQGRVVERGPAAAVLHQPQHSYTQSLLAADPATWPEAPRPPQGMPLLQARGLVKVYGGRRVVDALDLTVHAGERIALQGPSGAGKTTLGNLLVGVLKPDAGSLMAPVSLAPQARQKLYQDPAAAFAPLVALGTSLRDVCRLHRVPWAQVQTLLTRLLLDESLLARRPGAVSGGELQRLALLRALLVRPRLIFADEPTSRLDPLTQQQTIAVLLQAQQDQGFALVFVTHDPDLARHVAGTRLVSCWS